MLVLRRAMESQAWVMACATCLRWGSECRMTSMKMKTLPGLAAFAVSV